MAKKLSTGWSSFYTVADVAGSPDTTYIGAAGSWATGAYGSNSAHADSVDLYDIVGAGANLDTTFLEFIFSVSHATDGDGKTTVFELYASMGESGPRQAIVSLALVGGTAQVTAASDLVTWCDDVTVTNYRGGGNAESNIAILNDHQANNVASVTIPVLGMRHWEGLFTGAGSTAATCIAYYRLFTK